MPQLLFVNNTKMPILVSRWMKIIDGLSELNDITIEGNTEIRVKSENGKWYLSSLFKKEEHKRIWEKEELAFDSTIATIELNSGYIHNNNDEIFTEVYIDHFTLTYDDSKNSVTWNYLK